MSSQIEETQCTKACMEIRAGNKKWKQRWCWMSSEQIAWGKDPDKPKHRVLLSNLKVEVQDSVITVTDPACRSIEQLCVTVSEADTTSVSYLQEWKKRLDDDRVPESYKTFMDDALPNEEQSRGLDDMSTSRGSPMFLRRLNSSSPSGVSSPSVGPPMWSIFKNKNREKRISTFILPSEILVRVFYFLSCPDSIRDMALVSKNWLIISRSETLWSALYEDTWGTFYNDSEQYHRPTWMERFFYTRLIHDNWAAAKYRKKETIYVSFRTVRDLLWSDKHLALVYGNTIDFMETDRRRIVSRFSPDVSFIRGVDISGEIIACSAQGSWEHISLYKKEYSLNKTAPKLCSWRADTEIIDVVSFPNLSNGKKGLDRIFTGAKECKLWDTETQKCLFKLPAQNQGSVNGIQFDNDKVVCSHKGSKMRIWDLRSGQRIFALKGHQHLVQSFRFDDNNLVSCSKDTTLRIWDPKMNYNCRCVLSGHKTSVRALHLSPFRLVSGSVDDVRIWDLNTGTFTGKISLHDPTVSLTFDETHLFIGSGHLRLFYFSEKPVRKKSFLRKIF
eukprot:TRINITY_DN5499_c0_g1_i1.p1 TRINITY_DN5499_c0_g1~~TRINITY_DN5499_c0_g1_i1.p1  ORF type:complete len:558 (-),score=38.22 TRINITY_DN5499_c0_g1_i1:60-1733(-)